MIDSLKRYLLFLLVLVFLPASMAAESQENIKLGEKIYTEQCVLCHGQAGEGWDWEKKADKPPVPVPNLLEVIPERSDEYLATVIKLGGGAVGLTDFMPALGFNLTDQDLHNLIAYLRALKLKAPADGAFLEKSVPSQPDKLVWFPRKSSSLLYHLPDLILPAAFIRPSGVSFSEKHNRPNWFFQPNLQQGLHLLAHQNIAGKKSRSQIPVCRIDKPVCKKNTAGRANQNLLRWCRASCDRILP